MIEKVVETDITQKNLWKAIHAVLFQETTVCLIICWLVIFGLETYYRNVSGEPGTVYISGFFTWAVGVLLFQYIYRRVRNRKKLVRKLLEKGGQVTRKIRIDDSGLSISRVGIDSVYYDWSILMGSRIHRKPKTIELFFGGTKITLLQQDIGEDGMEFIKKKCS